jgi:cobalt-zinc-cadmium resistance protein CzcA
VLDFGLIIDGAVIIVESVLHQFSHNSKFKKSFIGKQEMDTIVIDSAGKMMNSAVFGQIIILIVYLPILTCRELKEKCSNRWQKRSFCIVRSISAFINLYSDDECFIAEKRSSKPSFSDRMMKKVEQIYLKTLLKILRIPKTVFCGVALFVLAIFHS